MHIKKRMAWLGGAVTLAALALFFRGQSQLGQTADAVELPDSVSRIQWIEVAGLDIGRAADVAKAGQTLYLLDRRQSRVAKLSAEGGQLTFAGAFGRPGDGPGELRGALDLATNGASVSVLGANGRISNFGLAGEFIQSVDMGLPCAAARSEVAFTASDTLVATRCASPRTTGDTIFGVFFRVGHGKDPEPLFSDALQTVRGDWGTIAVAANFLASDGDRAAFGTGVGDCVLLSAPGSPSNELCGLDSIRTDVPQSASDREELRRLRTTPGMDRPAYRWPKPFPAYIDKFLVGDKLGLVRMATSDTLFLAWYSSPTTPLLVGPVDQFVGCDNRACVWMEPTLTGARVSAYCMNADTAIPCQERAEDAPTE